MYTCRQVKFNHHNFIQCPYPSLWNRMAYKSHTLYMVTHDSDSPLMVIFLMPSFTNCLIVFLSSYWHGQILMQTTHSILNFVVLKCCCTSDSYNNLTDSSSSWSSMWWWTLNVFVLGPMHGNITKIWPVLYCITNSKSLPKRLSWKDSVTCVSVHWPPARNDVCCFAYLLFNQWKLPF